MLFSPHDLTLETGLDDELRSWFAFAQQKLDEIMLLKRAINEGSEPVAEAFALSRKAIESRRQSTRTNNPSVRARLSALDEVAFRRANPYGVRKAQQTAALRLPQLPTTTIGSFPQTSEIRTQRAAFNKGAITAAE